jgi:hypothetical protein
MKKNEKKINPAIHDGVDFWALKRVKSSFVRVKNKKMHIF